MLGDSPDVQPDDNCLRSPPACSTNDIMSPRGFSTPLKLNNNCGQSSTSFALRFLPNFSSPPSRIKEFVAKNPFESDLRNKLHLPMFSPSILVKSASKLQQSAEETFSWTIEDMSLIKPAPIEEKIVQVDESYSPKTESTVQDAIESFFGTTQALQSPWEMQKSEIANVSMSTSFVMHRSLDEQESAQVSGSEPEQAVECRDGMAQTVLTLPPVLPAELEAALSNYFSYHKDQQQESPQDSASFRANTSLSPYFRNSPLHRGSPITSGLLHVSSYAMPTQRSMLRNHNTPDLGIPQNFRLTPAISPIKSPTSSRLHSPRKSLAPVRNRSVISRLDFSDDGMSVDRSLSRHAMSLTEVGSVYADADKENNFNFSEFRAQQDTGYSTMEDTNAISMQHNDDISMWKPHSTHIVSSTPSKIDS